LMRHRVQNKLEAIRGTATPRLRVLAENLQAWNKKR